MSETAVAKREDVTTMDGKLDNKQLGALLAKMEPNKEKNLVADYFKLEPGEETKAIFIEVTKMQKFGGEDGETTPAVRILLPDGKEAINADKVLVTCLSRLPKLTPVLITCTGKAKGQNGQYSEFVVNPLVTKK